MLRRSYLVFVAVPTDSFQGPVQRIFYVHMAMWLEHVHRLRHRRRRQPALSVAARRARWDHLGRAAAELGLLFCSLGLATGSIWAKPIWGTWWTWDPRLTLTTMLWMIYAAYLLLRNLATEPQQGATLAAVLGVSGVVDLYLINRAVYWWRSIHPAVIVNREGGTGLSDPLMRMTLLVLHARLLPAVLLAAAPAPARRAAAGHARRPARPARARGRVIDRMSSISPFSSPPTRVVWIGVLLYVAACAGAAATWSARSRSCGRWSRSARAELRSAAAGCRFGARWRWVGERPASSHPKAAASRRTPKLSKPAVRPVAQHRAVCGSVTALGRSASPARRRPPSSSTSKLGVEHAPAQAERLRAAHGCARTRRRCPWRCREKMSCGARMPTRQ